ncbi:MAG: family N-acetyltransferase [Gammaproteobacteria bacterium]|nr:family N-acetyltransferase [Gammaproteobacteria bacterium]
MPQTHRASAVSAQLDNPVWHALGGLHQCHAENGAGTRWYPSTIAPFVAVPTAQTLPDLNEALARGLRDPAYFVGVLPDALPDGWHVVSRSLILQLHPASQDLPDPDEDGIRVLEVADRPRMLALARIAFPDFFRERTAELGLYLGIFEGENLVAMAGERLALEGMQEISGVCTHPGFVGRGSARRLTRALMHRHRRRGVASFLHVSEENTAARRLYDSMGFAVRAGLPMVKVARL